MKTKVRHCALFMILYAMSIVNASAQCGVSDLIHGSVGDSLPVVLGELNKVKNLHKIGKITSDSYKKYAYLKRDSILVNRLNFQLNNTCGIGGSTVEVYYNFSDGVLYFIRAKFNIGKDEYNNGLTLFNRLKAEVQKSSLFNYCVTSHNIQEVFGKDTTIVNGEIANFFRSKSEVSNCKIDKISVAFIYRYTKDKRGKFIGTPIGYTIEVQRLNLKPTRQNCKEYYFY